ncbi:hypothetical protein CRYUN_Cryun15aG0125300 [Craigia yunnanensis]
MRWLQNISFSFSSSSSSTTSATSATSPGKHFQDNHDYNYNQRNHNQRSNYRYLGFRIAGPKLTSQRELRRLRDQEVAQSEEVLVAPLSSSYDTPLWSSAPASRTTSSAVAVPLPLPLPLPVPEGDGEQRLPSPNEIGPNKGLEDRDREKADGTPSNSSMFASCDLRKTAEHVDTRSSSNSKVLYQEVNRGDNSQNEFRVNAPIRSAPASPFSSPSVICPHRMSTGDMFPHYMVPTAPIILRFTVHQIEVLVEGIEAKVDLLHQYIRGAAMATPSPSIPQVTTKPEPLPMKCQWQKGKLIGRGTFGSVYVASNRETGALCAMKEVEMFPDDPKSAECIKQLEQEIKVLSQLKHPNIVQYYGSEIAEDKFYIYLEYVHPGSINKYVHDHCGAITESVVRNFTRHILSGLAYLHSTKTIHRDIKGANLLVDSSGVVKLADFGMSKHLSGQRADLSLKGSPYWMAPELMQAVMQKDNSSDLALAVDIWSLGCTIVEMFNGKAPWSEYEGAAAMFKVMRDTPLIPEILSPEGKDFLRCCFRRNPAERPSASMLLEHRFVKCSQSQDMPISPRERSEFKLDQLPVQQSLRSTKTVTPDSETSQQSHYKSSDLTVAPCFSPRSTFEALPSLSRPRTGQNPHHPSPSGTTNRSINQESKKNHIFG